MKTFRSAPVDIMLINDTIVVDLFILSGDKLFPYIEKGCMLTRERYEELLRFGIRNLYIRSDEADTFDEYLSSHSEKILNDPNMPSKVKAATFYISSIYALKNAFDNPSPVLMDEAKKILKPMVKNILGNKVLMRDLFSITAYDYTTFKHSVNVGIYATAIAIDFYKADTSIKPEDIERLSYGYFFHDIGKSKLPLSIINKKGKLDQEEWDLMKKHPEWGYTILMETGNLTDEAAYISMQHHERPNGSGYPLGLKDIHPCARICTIADIYDALTATRPYKNAMKPFDALKTLKDEAFTEFDHILINRLITLLGPQNENK